MKLVYQTDAQQLIITKVIIVTPQAVAVIGLQICMLSTISLPFLSPFFPLLSIQIPMASTPSLNPTTVESLPPETETFFLNTRLVEASRASFSTECCHDAMAMKKSWGMHKNWRTWAPQLVPLLTWPQLNWIEWWYQNNWIPQFLKCVDENMKTEKIAISRTDSCAYISNSFITELELNE